MSKYVVHPAKEQNTDPRYIDPLGNTVGTALGETTGGEVKIPAWMAGAAAVGMFWWFSKKKK